MKQKALLVAVGDYQGFATQLYAPAKDILLWRAVLEGYGFRDIRQRIDSEAKRTVVMGDLQWLFENADEDDQLVFLFLGHGRLVDAHAGASEPYEEALIVYPDGDSTMKSAEITDSDVTKLLVDANLPKGVDAAIGLDTCFAGYFDVPVPPNAKLLVIPTARMLDVNVDNVRAFGSFGEQFTSSDRNVVRAERIERPIVVAACGRAEAAYELPVDGTPHMIFTLRATEYLDVALAQERDVTFDMLVNDIYPLADGVPQKPAIGGNRRRGVEHFPGQPGSPTNAQALQSFDGPAALVVSPIPLSIRFEGIGCFAAARNTADPYQKRLLFPYDGRTNPNLKHLTFIEIPEDHVDSSTGTLTPKKGPHVNDPTVYCRWELRGHIIRVINTDNSKPLFPTALFDTHVPKMIRVYPPFATTQYHPRPECFLGNPGANLLDAYFDLTAGTLRIGPLDTRDTVFISDSGYRTEVIRAARNTTMELPLTTEIATITVTPFGGGNPVATINVKRGGAVRIGNAREGDIIGDGTAEDPREHFDLYYNLSYPPPPRADRPLPARDGVPVNFCSQTHWP